MSQDDSLDDKTAHYLELWAQRTSRRGLLARVGTLALKAAGLSLLPMLPVDRAFAQFTCAGDWQTCGMHGFFCKACCGGAASYASCPACTNTGSYWVGCCHAPNSCGAGTTIRYFDCCGTKTGYTDTQARACQGDECPPGGGAGTAAYCGGAGTFRCTIVVNTGAAC